MNYFVAKQIARMFSSTQLSVQKYGTHSKCITVTRREKGTTAVFFPTLSHFNTQFLLLLYTHGGKDDKIILSESKALVVYVTYCCYLCLPEDPTIRGVTGKGGVTVRQRQWEHASLSHATH
jgi:hypothetical protein